MLKCKYLAGCLFFVIVFLSFSVRIIAQNEIKPDERLFVKYSQDYISSMLINNPENIDYLNFCLDNSCYFISEGSDKFVNSPKLTLFDNQTKSSTQNVVESINKSSFNILNYDLKLSYSQRTSYRIGNSNEVVIFYSLKEMADRYNKLKQSVK
ncbi:MAG: hypothetical protein HY951_16060 [Bacteroidia bacterium]|nr:hypothetical protein [Bacteroidia bacterium]